MDIAHKIQENRIKKGLSQEVLAEKLGVSRQSVSKWELGQSLPEVDKIVAMSKLFSITTDDLLITNKDLYSKPNENQLHFGSVYLVVKNFQKSIDFYEKFLSMRVSTINHNRFAEFFFDNKCISLMNESNLYNHNTDGNGDYKFVLNFWIDDLLSEFKRVKSLNIGKVTGIRQAHTTYYYFHLFDPDNNVIEITGRYNEEEKFKMGNTICQSCGMPLDDESLFRKNKDGSKNNDYCRYCFPNGTFSKDETMDEMIESCIPFRINEDCPDAETARRKMMEYFPTLKRWKDIL